MTRAGAAELHDRLQRTVMMIRRARSPTLPTPGALSPGTRARRPFRSMIVRRTTRHAAAISRRISSIDVATGPDGIAMSQATADLLQRYMIAFTDDHDRAARDFYTEGIVLRIPGEHPYAG